MYQAAITTSTAAPPAAACTLLPAQNGCYQLNIQGKFPPQWLAGLSSGLASRQINILQGHASKSGPAVWEASFLLEPPRHAGDLRQIDFLAMTQDRTTTPPAELRLIWHNFSWRDDSLLVEVKGADSIGFLVALLKRFAFYSLFPAQVELDTLTGLVHDRFFLKGLGGTAPSPASIEQLEMELARLHQ